MLHLDVRLYDKYTWYLKTISPYPQFFIKEEGFMKPNNVGMTAFCKYVDFNQKVLNLIFSVDFNNLRCSKDVFFFVLGLGINKIIKKNYVGFIYVVHLHACTHALEWGQNFWLNALFNYIWIANLYIIRFIG